MGAERISHLLPFKQPLVNEIKVQPHWHTEISDAFSTPEESVEFARGKVNILVITDHDFTEGALRALEYAQEKEYINLSNRAKDHFEVVVGQEVTTLEGHMIGLYLNSTVVCGMTAEETALEIKKQGGLVVIPHPDSNRESGIKYDAIDSLDRSNLVDAVETVNGGQESLALLTTIPLIKKLRRQVGSYNTNSAAQGKYYSTETNYAALGGHDGHLDSPESMLKVVTVFEEGVSFRTAIENKLTGPRTKSEPEIWNAKTLLLQNLKSKNLEKRRQSGDGIICVSKYYE